MSPSPVAFGLCDYVYMATILGQPWEVLLGSLSECITSGGRKYSFQRCGSQEATNPHSLQDTGLVRPRPALLLVTQGLHS